MYPRGWFGESLRHSLAGRGIRTRFYAKKDAPNRYFVMNELKGNRDTGGIKRAYAYGWSKEELKRDPSARDAFGVSLQELEKKPSSSAFKYPESSSSGEDVTFTSELPLAPTVEGSGGVPQFSEATTATTVDSEQFPPASTEPLSSLSSMPATIESPGVPSEPSSAQGAVSAPFKTKASTRWSGVSQDINRGHRFI